MLKEHESLFISAKKASFTLSTAGDSVIVKVLVDLSEILLKNSNKILVENQLDLDRMERSDPKYDRLLLNQSRIENLSSALIQLSGLPVPYNKVIEKKELKSGVLLEKWAVPMGVIGVIYESRPNVSIDVAAICLKSGNAAILKGGKEAFNTNSILVACIHEALEKNGLPKETISLFPIEREYLNALLTADKYVDLIIPRGSQSLIDYVRTHSKIPTIETGAGVCHTYIEKSANLNMAAEIIINARASRPSVCNSLDTVLVDKTIAKDLIIKLIPNLEKYNIEIYADAEAFELFNILGFVNLREASNETYKKEWLDFKMNFKIEENFDEAIEHINTYSSKHSEAIITENVDLAELFLKTVDAAAVYHNASTRFTDGEEFGLGAEIGISTQKLHARGPFALEKLVTEKWVGRGSGQVRW